jgi:chromatin assembly factor 1 subunit B
VLPCGIWRSSLEDEPKCCAYLFRKNYFVKPSFSVQTNKEPVLICKFCPLLFKKKNPEDGLFKQPYYMIFAIATTNSVLIYSTDSLKPLYGMGNFHFAALTDLAWKEAEILAISSSDGFISFFTFQKGELGESFEPEEGPLKEMITRTAYVAPVKPL